MSRAGKHYGRATDWMFGKSSTGKEQIAVRFRLEGGPHDGDHIVWYGFFTDQTAERTIESLRFCGWAGDNIVEIDALPNLVQLVVEEDTYDGRTRDRVRWINRIGGPLVRDQLEGAELADFARRMKAIAMSVPKELAQGSDFTPPTASTNAKASSAPPGAEDFDDIPF